MMNTQTQPRTLAQRATQPLLVGVVATTVMTLASWGGGSTRNRGGLLELLGWEFLAFGHGRNLSIALFWVSIFGLCAAWLLAGKAWVIPTLSADAQAHKVDQARVGTALWAWIIPLIFAGPIASRDVYSYLMQGAMVRDGFDPYTQGAAVNPGPFLLEVSQDWRNTTTPYGPLHLGIGHAITALFGDNVSAGVVAYKVISLAGFALLVWSVPRCASLLGANPAMALWLGVANPVMIIHLVGGMHNESIMVGLVSMGLYLVLRATQRGTGGGRNAQVIGQIAAATVLIGTAVSLKVTAFFILPFIFWIIFNYVIDGRRRAGSVSLAYRAAAFLGCGLGLIALCAATVALITVITRSSWGWISEISGNSKVINPLAAPTLLTDVLSPLLKLVNPGLTYNHLIELNRTGAMVIMAAGLVMSWLLLRKTASQAVAGATAAYAFAFVFNSVTLPWYYASVIALIGVFRAPTWLIKFATGASLFIAVSFAGDGNHQLYTLWWVAATLAAAWALTVWLFAPAAAKAEAGAAELSPA